MNELSTRVVVASSSAGLGPRKPLSPDPMGAIGESGGSLPHFDLEGRADDEERPGLAGALRAPGGLGAMSGPPCIQSDTPARFAVTVAAASAFLKSASVKP